MTDGDQARILIVDDDHRTRRLLSDFLEDQDYAVAAAGGGAEALAALRDPDETFDLVVLDIQMPGMDGTTVAREIRQDPRLVDLPILAFTAFSHPDDAMQILQAGCTAYLAKPANLRDIAEMVESLLEQQPE